MLFEPVRSAEPPTVSGSTGLMTSSTSWLDLRVAHDGFSAATLALKASIASPTAAGMSPLMRRSNSTRSGSAIAAWRFTHLRRADLPRAPTLRQALKIGSGTSNGPWLQPSFSRAPATSSLPSGEPCVAAVPALVGAPKPMIVLQAIIEGLSVTLRALRMARWTASGSCPSTACTCQPAAAKRFLWSSEVLSEVGPSIEMPLSSNSTISRPSPRWPASVIASWPMPSIRQPSPAMT